MFHRVRDLRQVSSLSIGILLSLAMLLLSACGGSTVDHGVKVPQQLYIGDVVLSGGTVQPEPFVGKDRPELIALIKRVSEDRNIHLGSVFFTQGEFEPDYSAMTIKDGWTHSQIRSGGQTWRQTVPGVEPEKLSGEGSWYTEGPDMLLTHVIESDDPALFNLILRGEFNRAEVQQHLNEINPSKQKNAPLKSTKFLASFILTGALDGRPFTIQFVQDMYAEFGKF